MRYYKNEFINQKVLLTELNFELSTISTIQQFNERINNFSDFKEIVANSIHF